MLNYIFIILLIAILSILMSMKLGLRFPHLVTLTFPRGVHIIIEGIDSLLMFLVFLASNHTYSKTKDERFVIVAGGFLISSIFNSVHIFTVTTYPYDFISVANIQKNPTLVYLLLSNLIIPLSIYFAITHKYLSQKIENYRFKIYTIYFIIFLTLTIFAFLTTNFLPIFLEYKFQIVMSTLEFINYSLYLILAFILINIGANTSQTVLKKIIIGLIVLGIGGLFYINPSIIQANELLAHILEVVGLSFILTGINGLKNLPAFLTFKDGLVAYLCLELICFYVISISVASALFDMIFPPFSAHVVIEFLLIFQLIIYLIVDEFTRPITNIIKVLNEYTPGEAPNIIPITQYDEIGILTDKINQAATLSWQRITDVSKMAERERLIRSIFEIIRKTLDPRLIKNIITAEICKALGADRCFILIYDSVKDYYYVDENSEYISSAEQANIFNKNHRNVKFKKFREAFKNNIEICFSNVEEYISTNSLEGTPQEEILREYNVKSCCNIPVYFSNSLLGYIILHYTNEYRELSEDDLSFLKIMATQIGIAIRQAELYEITQLQAEREKISRNIIEILRNTLDQNTIKHLFVKNIGKFFSADRVFFSDYNPKEGIYMPVDAKSEYLSSPEEKSFVNFDFSNSSIGEYIQPLLEKRELNIFNLAEYMQKNPKTTGMVSRFINADVKSSYNFPVIYEQTIMGYFCIEYTHKVNILADEDFGRIRNICTEAGIALYHANLYIKAKEATLWEVEFLADLSNEFQMPLNQIVEISEKLSKIEMERAKQAEYLKIINNSSKILLELTKNIIDRFELESSNFEITYEDIDSEQLIKDVANAAQLNADDKNIKIQIKTTNIVINGDEKIITRILYIFLTNIIKYMKENGSITIVSDLDNNDLVIIIKIPVNDMWADNLYTILEKSKLADSSYKLELKGTELEMDIAKKLIELHNGSVHVDLTEEQDIRFELIFPKTHKWR